MNKISAALEMLERRNIVLIRPKSTKVNDSIPFAIVATTWDSVDEAGPIRPLTFWLWTKFKPAMKAVFTLEPKEVV